MLKEEDVRIINQLLQQGKNVLINYQKSKNQLHIKIQEVKRVK